MGQNLEILTAGQAAKMLQTSRHMIYALIRRGKLKASRLGRREWRIARSQILTFCEEGHDRKRRAGKITTASKR
jgi:excisionase family DNA binding protein